MGVGGGGGMKYQLLSPKMNFVHVNLYLQIIKFQNSSLHSPSFAKSRIHSCNPLTLSGQSARLRPREGVVGSMGEGAGGCRPSDLLADADQSNHGRRQNTERGLSRTKRPAAKTITSPSHPSMSGSFIGMLIEYEEVFCYK